MPFYLNFSTSSHVLLQHQYTRKNFFAEYQLYWRATGHLPGGGGTPCTFPLDLPLHAVQLTELVCMVIMTMDSEILGITSPQSMHIQYLKDKKRNCFWKPVNFDHKCDTDWQLNEIMCQSPVEVSILPHFFSCCDRPLLRLITVFRSQKLNLPRDSQTQTHFYLHTVNLKLIYWKPVQLSSHWIPDHLVFVYFIQQEIERFMSK